MTKTRKPDKEIVAANAEAAAHPGAAPRARQPLHQRNMAQATDLKGLRQAVVDAASVGGGLWFSYLFVIIYFAIAVAGVTDRDLLFGKSLIRLPVLNVDLPLNGFFVIGPLVFLIVHAYVLVHFVLLADKVGIFQAELQTQITDQDARELLRRELPSNIFVQYLAGPRDVRTGIIGFMLRLIAQISLVVGPLILLVFFQLRFLPYHHEAITSFHRLTFVADLMLLWILWPSIACGKMTWISWRDMGRYTVRAMALASLASLTLVFAIATFPGEWLHAKLPSVKVVPTSWSPIRWHSLHDLLVGGEVDLARRRVTSLLSNRLVCRTSTSVIVQNPTRMRLSLKWSRCAAVTSKERY
jgi:hypothetical protein